VLGVPQAVATVVNVEDSASDGFVVHAPSLPSVNSDEQHFSNRRDLGAVTAPRYFRLSTPIADYA
jgi:hypothetical protein